MYTSEQLVGIKFVFFLHLRAKLEAHNVSVEQRRFESQSRAAASQSSQEEEQRKFEQYIRDWPHASMAVFLKEVELSCM